MQSLKTLVAVCTRAHTPILLQNVKEKLIGNKKGIKGALLNMQYKIYARDG